MSITNKKIGWMLTALGVLGILLSVLIDLLPSARPGIQAAQILGIEVAMIVLFAGAWMTLADTETRFEPGSQVRKLISRLLDLPVIAWVLVGLLIAYLLFFIGPLLLNDTQRIRYFVTYLPDRFPIGNDLIAVLDLMKGWFFEGRSPYEVQFYPPFTYIFFSPLLLAGDYPVLFLWFTLASIAFYVILTLILPIRISGRENLPMILLLFLPGLVSYGLQFELERGQYNVFTFLLCLLAIHIFRNHPRRRILAYALFTVSVQLKLYPAIFIVMFVDDWRDWKTTLRRFAGIGIVNFLLLFIMGGRIFTEFVRSAAAQIANPGWGWNGNHSIKAFVGNLAGDGFGLLPPGALGAIQEHASLLATLLLVVFLLLFIFSIVLSIHKGGTGIDAHLLITCMIGALIIPISNDYTLSILAAPMILLLGSLAMPKNVKTRVFYILLVLGIAVSYFSLLVPFKYKPYFLANAFPPLFLILIFASVLNFIEYRDAKARLSSG